MAIDHCKLTICTLQFAICNRLWRTPGCQRERMIFRWEGEHAPGVKSGCFHQPSLALPLRFAVPPGRKKVATLRVATGEYPQPDLNRCYRTENPGSWAARRWGRLGSIGRRCQWTLIHLISSARKDLSTGIRVRSRSRNVLDAAGWERAMQPSQSRCGNLRARQR